MRHGAFRLSDLTIACALAALSAGCATSGASSPSAVLPEGAAEESAWAYFIDTGDDGDDIWTGGCHRKCSDPECAGETEFWGGDWCSGNDLQEWTNSRPHAAESDISRYDCAEECRKKGFSGGRCVRVEKVCDDRWSSSHCECDENEEGS